MSVTSAEFEVVRRLLHERSAIVLEPGKEYLVEARLAPLARAEGCTLGQFIGRLRAGDRRHVERTVEALTTNETAFFRDLKPFETLRTKVLPEVIRARSAARTLNIWCAASSSGQEPYTIAMTLREHFPELASWRVRILCTDISAAMVQRTREGRYSQLEVGRGLPAPMLVKYFTRSGLDWVVTPELQRWIEVRQLNLAAPWPVLGRQDIVFCRNVLIYFDIATKRSILRRVRETLHPEGYLFLGAAETTRGLDDQYEALHVGSGGCYRPAGGRPTIERRAS